MNNTLLRITTAPTIDAICGSEIALAALCREAVDVLFELVTEDDMVFVAVGVGLRASGVAVFFAVAVGLGAELTVACGVGTLPAGGRTPAIVVAVGGGGGVGFVFGAVGRAVGAVVGIAVGMGVGTLVGAVVGTLVGVVIGIGVDVSAGRIALLSYVFCAALRA